MALTYALLAARKAHSIEGASASAGGVRIRKIVLAMEEAGKAENLKAMETVIGASRGEVQKKTNAVQEECHAGHN
jgi:HPt (histidine-containing phosphotransfer) domain-containing protein